VLGQASLEKQEAELAEARARLAAPGLTETDRFALIKRCDAIEERMLADASGDDRAATWLADRAACEIELASEGGADAAVLYGLPTIAQQRAVHARARDALDLLARADRTATQTVARLEAELIGTAGSNEARARAKTIERTLSSLVESDQSVRIPNLRTMARLLLGASSAEPAERENVQTAARDLAARPPGAGAQADARAVALGTALVHTARWNVDRVDEVYDAAATELRPVAKKYTPGAGAESALALRARLALLRAGREAPARPRSEDAALERTIDLMEAEARSAAMFDRARREPGARSLLLGSAIRMLVDAVKEAGGADDVRLRAYEKLAAALPADAPLDRLPAVATLARAIARVHDGGLQDALAREDAAALLRALAARPDASPDLRSQARWELAVIAGASQDRLAELDALATIVRSDTESERGLTAAKRIFELFAREQGTGGPSSLEERWRSRVPLLREALALLIRRDTAGSARWKSESIRLSIADLNESPGARGFEAVDRALALLESNAGTPAEINALSDSLWRNLDRRATTLAERGRAEPESSVRTDWEALVPEVRRASAWAKSDDPARSPAYGVLLGEAEVGAGVAECGATLSGLSGSAVDRPGSPLFIRYRLALARSQRAAGEKALAITTYRDLADRLEGAPGSPSPEPAYWAAWSETLAIMQSENTDGARTGEIRVQIKRLELVDAKLGGSPYAERIRRIRDAIGE
jgi:hypothetical protein